MVQRKEEEEGGFVMFCFVFFRKVQSSEVLPWLLTLKVGRTEKSCPPGYIPTSVTHSAYDNGVYYIYIYIYLIFVFRILWRYKISFWLGRDWLRRGQPILWDSKWPTWNWWLWKLTILEPNLLDLAYALQEIKFLYAITLAPGTGQETTPMAQTQWNYSS